MEILYTAFSYLPNVGGGELHLHEIVRRMADRGHRVAVASQRSRPFGRVLPAATILGQTAARFECDGVPVRRLGVPGATRLRMAPWVAAHRGGGRLALRASERLTELLDPVYGRVAGRPDLIHAVRMGYGFLIGSALAHARRCDVPFVFTRMHHDADRPPQREQYDRMARAADAVIALTEYERELLVTRTGVAEERVHVTGVGPVLAAEADVEAFRREYGIQGPYVLFLGRQVLAKGIAALLAAAPRVWRSFPDVEFVFAGPPNRHSRRLFREQHDARVRNLGAVDLVAKTAALAGCELLCLPSRKESFGGVFTEAWSFGKPVVGARIPAIASVVEDGRTGLLADPEPGELADRILELLRSPARARALGEAGRRLVAERYGWERLAALTDEVYAAVC